MEDTISRKEHEEFSRRIDEENERQNKRLSELEKSIKQIGELTATVKELAVNMKNMLVEQEKQGTRLDSIEKRDGEMWRKVTSHIITLLVGAVAAYIFAHMGL